MEPTVINVTAENYAVLMAECYDLAQRDPDACSPDGERLTELAAALEAYEKEKYPHFLSKPDA